VEYLLFLSELEIDKETITPIPIEKILQEELLLGICCSKGFKKGRKKKGLRRGMYPVKQLGLDSYMIMTEDRKKLIDKASKIAARMQSPFENEVLIASMMLRKLLDDHNLSMQDIGLKGEAFKSAQSSASTSRETTNVPAPARPIYSCRVVPFTGSNNIKELRYRHGSATLPKWQKEAFTRLSWLFDVAIIYYDNYSIIAGYSEDVEIFKNTMVYMKNYLESQISAHGYRSEQEILGFLYGFLERLRASIKKESIPKSAQLSQEKGSKIDRYLEKRYNIKDKTVPLSSYDQSAYDAGMSDDSSRLAIERS
jgi:hypothetical protein